MILILLVMTVGYGQEQHEAASDLLVKKPYGYLQEQIDESADPQSGSLYNKVLMKKATEEQNQEMLFQGYKNYLHLNESYSIRLQYADSMLRVSLNLSDGYTASAHLTKGAVYYSEKKYKPALDCYLKAKDLLSAQPVDSLYYKTQYCIGQVKYYLGYYPQAIRILTSCRDYFKQQEPRGYINTLHLLGLCYNRSGAYELCNATNEIGIKEASLNQQSDMLPYFLHSNGVNQYFLGHYGPALRHLKSTLPFLIDRRDYANISVAWFYIGMSLEKTGKYKESLLAYEKVDSIFREHHYIRPDLVHAFYALAEYGKAQSDLKGQLRYTAALVSADSLIHTDFKYLSDKLDAEYDPLVPQMEKKMLENAAHRNGKISNWWHVLWLTAVVMGTWFLAKRLKNNHKPNQIPGDHDSPRPVKNQAAGLREDVAYALLERLEKFEREKKFLRNDMNLAQMAKQLDTNTKYVSMLIHEYKGKKTTEYLNDLRIDYLVALLQADTKTQNYTHKALAAEIGLSTTNSLHKAFLSRTGTNFTTYLESLQRAGN